MRLDAHHHFWEYDSFQYSWITEKLSRLKRNYLPADFQPLLSAASLDGCIAVQARQTLEESRWLLELADQHSIIKGVVGWADLRAENVANDLAKLSKHPRFVGVRHIAQDEPNDRFLMGSEFVRGIEKLEDFDLAYDLLVFPNQLSAAIDLVRKFPQQRFVLDHIAKPRIADGIMQPWLVLMRELASAPNVMCKISGLVTEANWTSWEKDDFAPYLDAVGEAFGPDRLMYGSDWPVCLLAGDYAQVYQLASHWVERVFPEAVEKIFGDNCARFYKIPV